MPLNFDDLTEEDTKAIQKIAFNRDESVKPVVNKIEDIFTEALHNKDIKFDSTYVVTVLAHMLFTIVMKVNTKDEYKKKCEEIGVKVNNLIETFHAFDYPITGDVMILLAAMILDAQTSQFAALEYFNNQKQKNNKEMEVKKL